MAVPPLKELYRPVLEILAESGDLTRPEIVLRVGERLLLTPEDMQEKTASGVNIKIVVRVGWAVSGWKGAKLLESRGGGRVRITPQGRDFLARHPGQSVISPPLVATETGPTNGPINPPVPPVDGDVAPSEQIALSYRQHQNMLVGEVLESLKGISPDSSERLVVALLSKMGYGDGRVVGQSGDQGIDGILDEDTLGLEKIYIQAKRWTKGTVGSPEVNGFAGALNNQGATKGVLITTSTFSPAARLTAQNISLGPQSIRLIDGPELAELMIRHGVGVVTEITYEVKKLDANYFAEV